MSSKLITVFAVFLSVTSSIQSHAFELFSSCPVKEFPAKWYEENVVKDAIRCGQNLNERMNTRGETALMSAMYPGTDNNELEIIHMLINARGVELNLQDYRGFTALMKSVIYGEVEKVRMLANTPGIDLNLQNKHGGYTALTQSVVMGNVEKIRILVNAPGIDLNLPNKINGFTAIEIAARMRNIHIVHIIATSPNGKHISSESIERAKTYARTRGYQEIIDYLESL